MLCLGRSHTHSYVCGAAEALIKRPTAFAYVRRTTSRTHVGLMRVCRSRVALRMYAAITAVTYMHA